MSGAPLDPWQMPMGWCPHEPAFRLVAPTAVFVELIFRDRPDGERQETRAMTPVQVGERRFWQWSGSPPLPCYRFRVHLADRTLDVADPWAVSVARRKAVGDPAWAVAQVNAPEFDWRGHRGVEVAIEEAVILEMHVADQSSGPSAGARAPGSWQGLIEDQARGGLAHALRLGVNAIELLPVTSWPVNEGEQINHWGYMPSFFCAVSERYSRAYGDSPPGSWPDFDEQGRFVDPGLGLKAFVRACHAAGVAVILDVVYNHVSMHDRNPLLLLDPGTWFHRDEAGGLRTLSGCGNDLNSADPEMRALILHSVRHWMQAYRIDGLRLDLAELLDDRTLAAIAQTARAVRPDALLVAEPWSFAGHRPAAIAALGYAVWNDRGRHAIKGRAPDTELGFAFGGQRSDARSWSDELRVVLAGCAEAAGGHLPTAAHSLNYIESHDDRTLGDFVRLALGQVRPTQAIRRADVAPITGRALAVHRLAAALLLTCRGPVMLAQGQCWGRAKVEPRFGPDHGPLSGNSWSRADSTNQLHWLELDANAELAAWYRDLIAWRKRVLLPAWRRGAGQCFIGGDQGHAVGYLVEGGEDTLAVLFNGSPTQPAQFDLPAGAWQCQLGSAALVDLTDRTRARLEAAGVAIMVAL